MVENNDKVEKLCAGFSLLDEKDKEYMLGILQALLFAKRKADGYALDPESLRKTGYVKKEFL